MSLNELKTKNIQECILEELQKATVSIHIAVAWFTDEELFDAICQKQGSGVDVDLIIANEKINFESQIKFSRLTNLGGTVKTPLKGKKGLMHHKFCIVDGRTVLHGSYNWTNKAKHNNESITLTTEDYDLANDFLDEFWKLSDVCEEYFHKENAEIPESKEEANYCTYENYEYDPSTHKYGYSQMCSVESGKIRQIFEDILSFFLMFPGTCIVAVIISCYTYFSLFWLD